MWASLPTDPLSRKHATQKKRQTRRARRPTGSDARDTTPFPGSRQVKNSPQIAADNPAPPLPAAGAAQAPERIKRVGDDVDRPGGEVTPMSATMATAA
jgi:hypothetical protein